MPAIKRYGYEFPNGSNDLSIELSCYADNKAFAIRGEQMVPLDTGHTPEYHLRRAWQIVWPSWQWNDWADRMVWAFCNYRIITIIGHAAAGKSFVTSRWSVMDWIARPFETSTTISTPKFDSLRTRIWGDLMQGVEVSPLKPHLEQAFQFTTTSNELKIKVRDKNKADADKFVIQGVAADSADINASKLRGQHTPRRRIIADECEHMGEVLFSAINNARVDPDFRAILLTNPSDRESEYSQKWAQPKDGWSSVDENDLGWETRQPHGYCVHFNALQSPNVKAKKKVVAGLMESEAVETIRKTEGESSLAWYMYVLGFPPPDGVVTKVWPSQTLDKARRTETFDYAPQRVASLDPAFQHDDCVLILGNMGRLRDGKPCISAQKSVKIKVQEGAERMLKEEQIAESVMQHCQEWGVGPENFIMDCTGQGRGVYEILRKKWSDKVNGLTYNDVASKRPIREGGKPAAEVVIYYVSELWFRASYLAADGMLCGLGNLDGKTTQDLSARHYSMKNNDGTSKMVVESKDDLKKRLGRSPDFGDTFCQLGELMVRRGMIASYQKRTGVSGWGKIKELALKAQKLDKINYGNSA